MGFREAASGWEGVRGGWEGMEFLGFREAASGWGGVRGGWEGMELLGFREAASGWGWGLAGGSSVGGTLWYGWAMAVIGLDLGTSGVKAVAVDAAGRVVGSARAGVALRREGMGTAEQDVEAIWAAACDVLRQAGGSGVEAVAISGAMHSLVPVDGDGRALAGAMTWADRRAAATAWAGRIDADALYRRTGCPPGELYHPLRLRWWAGQGVRPARWASIKDVVVHRLTGRWAADLSVASATGLVDIHRRGYDGEALKLAGIDATALPPLVEPTAVVGPVSGAASAATGLGAGLPVVAGASDGALANVGAAGPGGDDVVITVGTSAAVRRLVDRPRFDPQRRTWCYIATADRYVHGSAMNNAGLAVSHAAGGDGSIGAALRGAAAVAPGCGGVTVLPFVTGERGLIWPPHVAWAVEPSDRASADAAVMMRATLEGVCCGVAELWDAVTAEGRTGEARLSGGIVGSPLWSQMLADMLGVRLRPIEAADASALGAAKLGGQAIGRATGPPAGEGPGVLEPNRERSAAYEQVRRRFRTACERRGWMRNG